MVTVRYFAGARAAAGTGEEQVDAATLDELILTLSARHGSGLEKVLEVASFLVDEVVCHDRGAALPAGAGVDVLPPFAGG
ncbi:MoaD/ThiS family protein [Planosporangium mesophilum]|uniref:Molybdopterin synthase sulfur carrier subunit n=1 Tax=Planosporangium mesophilum TaxID=689768 RepID=A0A8J3X2X6_9ACTN|nr:MoaD/ThiS family protein [Planosporangium mesophilum]NJC82272.1 MoaD/ThiS family protein [Planosporangium mesophilum]GII22323.1 molybdopterin synthase sulfur carrier subunit [Planosporangium mesophilum]